METSVEPDPPCLRRAGLSAGGNVDEADAEELGALEVEFAHFLANAAEGGGICHDFRGIEGFLNDGKVFGDARMAGLGFGFLPVIEQRGFRGRAGSLGDWRGRGRVSAEHQHELGGIEIFAGSVEDAPAQRVDGLVVEGDFGSLGILTRQTRAYYG